MTHLDRIRELERAVIEAAKEFAAHPDQPLGRGVDAAVAAILGARRKGGKR